MSDPSTSHREAAHPFRLRLALASFAAGGAVLLAVIAGLTRQTDAALLDKLRLSPEQPAWLLEAVRDLTALGSFTVLGLAVLATTAFLAAKGRWALAARFLASALGATTFSSLLKLAVDRSRPDAVEALAATFTRSFPSGHALLTTAIVLTIGGFLSLTIREAAARKMVWALAGTTAVMVGLSRLFLGVHWPSDVLAGWFFGLGWALLTLNWTARSWPGPQG